MCKKMKIVFIPLGNTLRILLALNLSKNKSSSFLVEAKFPPNICRYMQNMLGRKNIAR